MRKHLGGTLLLAAALALAGCEQDSEDAVASSHDFADQPCAEVVEEFRDAREALNANFGAGEEGREAAGTIVEAADQRPDCFSDEEVEAALGLRYMLPASDAEADAVQAAEEACDTGLAAGAESHTSEGPDDPAHTTAEEALADQEQPPVPDGDPERADEHDDWVAFDYHDDGEYQGWVMVEERDGGWFVRRIIDCQDEGVGESSG